LHERAGNVEVRITDNGKGFDSDGSPDFRRWGLVGMAERVGSFKGRFGITRATPHGTTVNVWIPAGRPARTSARL
jgi:signal transduction histidine kinase